MKIEHVAMYVKDLEQVKWFFENYFGAKSNAGYHNESTDFQSYFLTFDDGARLEIMSKPVIKFYLDQELPEMGIMKAALSIWKAIK